MNTLSIEEGNKLIAEFDGWYQLERTGAGIYSLENPYYKNNGKEAASIHGFEYHTSWDWLMPVVEKIEKLGYATQMNCYPNNYCSYIILTPHPTEPDRFTSVEEQKINAVLLCVIQFIQWYNTTKSKP